MLRSGDEIGPYILINKLGKGAFGVVWLAERRTQITTTTAAIKIPLDEDISIESIKNEADLWVRASGHPNILPIIEANIYDEQIIIASEYAPDGSLDAVLKQNGKVPTIESAVEIVSGILAGLEHLHSRNIIHRDLKPANILFQGNTPRLADFGISRVLKSTSQSSNIMGTPSYMAPEAFDGKRNEQTDIWSVGVIFYQLLAGHLPYREEDITSLVGAILMRNPEPLPLGVPKPLQNVIARALAKDPNIRYKSATEMRSALRNPHETDPNFQPEKSILTVISPSVNTSPPQSFHPPTKEKSNTPHLIYAIAGLLAVVIVIVGLIWVSNSKPKEISSIESPTPKISVQATPVQQTTQEATKCLAKKGSPCFLYVPLGPNKTIWTGGEPVDVKFKGKTTFLHLDQKGSAISRKDFNPGEAEFRVPANSKVDTIQVEILSRRSLFFLESKETNVLIAKRKSLLKTEIRTLEKLFNKS